MNEPTEGRPRSASSAERPSGPLGELVSVLARTKWWWLTTLLLAVVLFGVLAILSDAEESSFLYTQF